MASGTKTRVLARLLDGTDSPVWAIGPDGTLTYLSAPCQRWLGVDIERLLGRRSIAGSPVSDDPLDRMAAAMSPPPGLASRGTAWLLVQPPAIADHVPESLKVQFLRVGSQDSSITLAVSGEFTDEPVSGELQDAVAIRQRLDRWRRLHGQAAAVVTLGESTAARRMRRRLSVAKSTRSHIALIGPTGCGFDSIATHIHDCSAGDEPLIVIDGSLMDGELLESAMSPAIDRLTGSDHSQASALIRHVDEMPLDAQTRLAAIVETFASRLRLIALCDSRSIELPEETSEDNDRAVHDQPERLTGICSSLLDLLCSLTIAIQPLAERVEDIPLMATALVDGQAAAERTGERRLSRSALDRLVTYPWPHNFDELVEAIDHAMRRTTGESIGAEQLPLAVRSYRPGDPTAGVAADSVRLDDAVSRFEQQLIRDAIEASDGNRAEAARRLGISRARLIRKIDEATS